MANLYSKEQLENIVKESSSIADCLRKLGKRPVGGNYKPIQRLIKKYSINISHFNGHAWNKGKKCKPFYKRSLEELLVENSDVSSVSLKKRLIKAGLKEEKCERCDNKIWNGLKIPLELEHSNGNNTDNRIENLKLLCPNCHAQTPFYRGRNILSYKNEKRKEEYINPKSIIIYEQKVKSKPKPRTKTIKEKSFCVCGSEKHFTSVKCRQCDLVDRSQNRPPIFQLIADFKELKSFVRVGKKYGVSDNAIRKWLELYQVSIDEIKNH